MTSAHGASSWAKARPLRLRTPLARFMGPATVQTPVRPPRHRRDIDAGTRRLAPVDFHAAVDRRIPSLVYCHLAGAPPTDAPRVQSLSERTLSLLARDRSLIPSSSRPTTNCSTTSPISSRASGADGLGEDMLSYLIRSPTKEADRRGTVRRSDLDARSQFREHRPPDRSGGLDAAARPGGLAAARRGPVADPGRRRRGDCGSTPAPACVSKIATEDIELDGTTIPAGSDVHVAVWSANRDPERFDEPTTSTWTASATSR